MADTINVCTPGHADGFDSYGLIFIELIRHLDRMGVYVNAMALGDVHHANQPEDVMHITNRPIRAAFNSILLGYPTGWGKHSPLAHYGPRVGVTMFESSKPPPGWAAALNQLDAVITPSTFCRDVFTAAGVMAPIHVAPLGIADVFRPSWRVRSPDAPYTFLATGDRGRRKGIHEAIQAFLLAFGDSPDYRLVIKARETGYSAGILNENIDVIRRDMTAEELYRLYLDCDCMVFPSRGEGFGLPCREFSATGAPAIATNWSGLADDIDLWGIPLGYELVTADWKGSRNLEGLDLGVWADPDVEDLARLMRQVADRRAFHQQQAMERATAVRDLYDWRRFARAVYHAWHGAAYKEVAIGHGIAAPALA